MPDMPTTRVEIDLNIRARGGMARVGFEDADGPLQPGQTVQVYETETRLTAPGVVNAINPTKRFAWIVVDWKALSAPTGLCRWCDRFHPGQCALNPGAPDA
jgi:hypothetical protein